MALADVAIALTTAFRDMLADLSDGIGDLDDEGSRTFNDALWNEPLDGQQAESMEAVINRMMTTMLPEVYRAGTVGMSSTTQVVTGLGFADNNYSIQLTPSANKAVWYTSKTQDGFVVNAATTGDSVDWSATRHV